MTHIATFFSVKPFINAHNNKMGYFNYHACAKKLITDGKLLGYYFTEKHNAIKPALVLIFDSATHPVMPIRQNRWSEYLELFPQKLLIHNNY